MLGRDNASIVPLKLKPELSSSAQDGEYKAELLGRYLFKFPFSHARPMDGPVYSSGAQFIGGHDIQHLQASYEYVLTTN